MAEDNHSVYLAGTNWVGFLEKGSGREGVALGVMPHECVNLDRVFPVRRVKCVRNIG
jgi:hypothetical protein